MFLSFAFIVPSLPQRWHTRALPVFAVTESTEILVKDNLYAPSVIQVKPGSTMVFYNQGKQLHSVTLVGHEDILDQEFIDPGKSFTFAVPADMAPGEYSLGCNIHVDMKGTLVVRAR
jgi:plastocyanin